MSKLNLDDWSCLFEPEPGLINPDQASYFSSSSFNLSVKESEGSEALGSFSVGITGWTG